MKSADGHDMHVGMNMWVVRKKLRKWKVSRLKIHMLCRRFDLGCVSFNERSWRNRRMVFKNRRLALTQALLMNKGV